jgi:hypothetical protein
VGALQGSQVWNTFKNSFGLLMNNGMFKPRLGKIIENEKINPSSRVNNRDRQGGRDRGSLVSNGKGSHKRMYLRQQRTLGELLRPITILRVKNEIS